MANRIFSAFRPLIIIALIFCILACTISIQKNEPKEYVTQSGEYDYSVSMSDFPEMADFGDLSYISGPALSVAVRPETNSQVSHDGAALQIPAGAFPEPNLLKLMRVDTALNLIAPDVTSAVFFVVSTEKDVPALGALITLEVSGLSGDVTAVRYDSGAWVSAPLEPGQAVRVSIDHFSKGIFGFVEWWSERDIALGSEIDNMDYDTGLAQYRNGIEQGDEDVRAFFGVNEQSSLTDKEICDELITSLKKYNKPGKMDFPEVKGSTTDLGAYLFAGSSPSVVGGPFWKATEDSMEEIADNLLAKDKQISPAEFLKLAIDANKGNIPLGVLAAHNYLKELTYQGRHAYRPSTGLPREYGEPASRLLSWRQGSNVTPEGLYDKMGPLYHIFAAMTGALWLPTRASGPVIASGEAFLRTFRVGGDRPDTSKAAADQCGIDAAAWLRNNPPKEGETPVETPPSSFPAGDLITMTGTVTAKGFNPGIKLLQNSISITFRDDGKGEVTGTGMYSAIYMRGEECNKEIPLSSRWELTGKYNPDTRRFSGTMQEYGKGQAVYTDCSVGDVSEYLNGEGGTWEGELEDGVIRGSITLDQGGGAPPLERVTFELR